MRARVMKCPSQRAVSSVSLMRQSKGVLGVAESYLEVEGGSAASSYNTSPNDESLTRGGSNGILSDGLSCWS